jgi:hypothetical protein
MLNHGRSVGLGRLALPARPNFRAQHALIDKRVVCGSSGFAASGGFGGCHRTNIWGSGCQRQGTFAPFSIVGAIRHEHRGLSSTPVVVGAADGQERPRKSACKSWSYLAEIVGNQQLAGRGIRTSAGEILKLIDLSASFAASLHCGNPFTTTLAFDHVELTVPILHGDMSVSQSPHSQKHSAPCPLHCIPHLADGIPCLSGIRIDPPCSQSQASLGLEGGTRWQLQHGCTGGEKAFSPLFGSSSSPALVLLLVLANAMQSSPRTRQ